MKILISLLLLVSTPLLGDVNPAYPPNPYDSAGGKLSPGFSKANAQSIYWINLVDQKQYSATWLEAGGLLKDVITQDQWAFAMKGIRAKLGVVHARKVASHQTTQKLPYGTRGNFMIITYDTDYQNAPGTREYVTLMTEGQLALWKVVGYRIKKR